MWNRPISEPTDSQEFYRRAVAHLRTGNARMAIDVCEKSLKSFPGDANILCLAAKANLALRQFGESQARAEEAIRLFPDFSTAHEILGDSSLPLRAPLQRVEQVRSPQNGGGEGAYSGEEAL